MFSLVRETVQASPLTDRLEQAVGAASSEASNVTLALPERPGARVVSLRGPAFVGRTSALDVRQGGLPDCYLIASIAAAIAMDPLRAREIVRSNPDGSYTVRLFVSGRLHNVQVPAQRYADQAGAAAFAHNAGTGRWVEIIENAWLVLRGESAARGGDPRESLHALTGVPTESRFLPAMSDDEAFALISQACDERRAVVFNTYGLERRDLYNGTGLYPWHCYSVLGTRVSARGELFVIVRNPWGFSEPGNEAAGDGIFELPISRVRQLFAHASYALATPPVRLEQPEPAPNLA